MQLIEERWKQLIKKVREFVENDNFYIKYIEPLQLAKKINNSFYCIVDSNFAYETLTDSYIDVFNQLAPSIFESNSQIYFVRNAQEIPDEAISKNNEREISRYSSYVKKTMLFFNFVVGEANRIAYEACIKIANDKKLFTPIFLYGGTGLGKTHLANALANEYIKKHPSKTIIYTNSDDFTRNVVESIHAGKAEELKRIFKTCDLLIVEDVQFLIRRHQTNEIFFSIFNHLADNGKIVVFTSDKAPENLFDLEPRMISRFNSGLVIEVKKPDAVTLAKILRLKLDEIGPDAPKLTDAAINRVVSLFNTDVRKLEGIIKRILFSASSLYQYLSILDVEQINKILESEIGILSREINHDPSIVLEKVCREFNVPKIDVLSASRRKEFVSVRKLCMYVFWHSLKMSLSDIGRFFSRDHSTVKAAITSEQKALDADPNLKNFVEELTSR